jgi:hypothetical protein
VQRQTALKQQRENAAAPRAAEAFRVNNPTELGAQFILGDRQGADFNAFGFGTLLANSDTPLLFLVISLPVLKHPLGLNCALFLQVKILTRRLVGKSLRKRRFAAAKNCDRN